MSKLGSDEILFNNYDEKLSKLSNLSNFLNLNNEDEDVEDVEDYDNNFIENDPPLLHQEFIKKINIINNNAKKNKIIDITQ